MRASDYLKSRFFTAEDFSDRPENWTIVSIAEETIGRDNPTAKPVLELSDSTGTAASRLLPLNKTNLGALAKVYGDDMKSWVGRPIRICSVAVSFRGEQTRGVRVMPGAVAVREPVRAGAARSIDD
jgi:hypothetical protein